MWMLGIKLLLQKFWLGFPGLLVWKQNIFFKWICYALFAIKIFYQSLNLISILFHHRANHWPQSWKRETFTSLTRGVSWKFAILQRTMKQSIGVKQKIFWEFKSQKKSLFRCNVSTMECQNLKYFGFRTYDFRSVWKSPFQTKHPKSKFFLLA